MPGPGRRRFTLLVLADGGAASASMLAPAFGKPNAVSAASLASKLAKTLKIADRNAKRAIAGLQVQGARGPEGPPGAPGAAGPKGDTGAPGSASNTGATGPKGDRGDKGDQGDKGDKGDQGQQGIQGVQGNTGAAGVADSTVVFLTFSTPGGGFASGVANCPNQQPHVLGGGYELPDSIGNLANVMQSRPLLGENGWVVRIRSGAQNAFNTTAYAVCG